MSATIALIALVCRHSEGIALATGVDENILLDQALAAKAEHDQLRRAACTPAERAVLDAVAAATLCDDDPDLCESEPWEPQEHGEDCYLYTDDQYTIAKAELARRGGGC